MPEFLVCTAATAPFPSVDVLLHIHSRNDPDSKAELHRFQFLFCLKVNLGVRRCGHHHLSLLTSPIVLVTFQTAFSGLDDAMCVLTGENVKGMKTCSLSQRCCDLRF